MTINIGNPATPATAAQLSTFRLDLNLGYGAIVTPGMTAPYAVFSGNKSSATGVTIMNKIQAPGAFGAVRLVYHNRSNADVTLNWSRIATTTTTSGTGSSLSWTNVTFNGGSTSPVTLPAFSGALLDEVLTPVISDLIILTPADTNNYIVTRSYYPGATGCTDAGSTADISNWRGASGLYYSADTVAGDIANNAGVNGSSADITPHAVIFYMQNPTVSVGCFGGSHLRGNGTTGSAWGFVNRACKAKTDLGGKIFVPYMNARGGQGNAAASQNVEKVLQSGYRLDVAVILGFSGNDGDYTATGFAKSRGYLARMLEACRKYGTRPIVCTAPPSEVVYTGGDETRRTDNNTWIRGLAAYGIDVLDLDLMYRDPSQTDRLLPAYNAGDNVHVNDTGQAVSRDALMALLN